MIGSGWCSVTARAVDEPLGGTAPRANGWVCVEQRGAWPLRVETHREPGVRALAVRAAADGWRLLLIRRPGRSVGPGPTRVLLTDVHAATTRTLTVEGPDELASLPLDAGEPVRGGVLAVCTHGRRDRCCALDGRALARDIAGAGDLDVWECSHLGGHRFAPTALVLPTGYMYGRLDASMAVAAGKAAGIGEVEHALCRGRTLWSPPGQVAELAVRAVTGLRDLAALTVDATDPALPVVSGPGGRRWAVPITEVETPARTLSCGAAPLPTVALRAGRVRPLA